MAFNAEHGPLVSLTGVSRAHAAKTTVRYATSAHDRRYPICPCLGGPELSRSRRVLLAISDFEEATMGRGLLLWLIGVPIPVIILLWLFFGR